MCLTWSFSTAIVPTQARELQVNTQRSVATRKKNPVGQKAEQFDAFILPANSTTWSALSGEQVNKSGASHPVDGRWFGLHW